MKSHPMTSFPESIQFLALMYLDSAGFLEPRDFVAENVSTSVNFVPVLTCVSFVVVHERTQVQISWNKRDARTHARADRG